MNDLKRFNEDAYIRISDVTSRRFEVMVRNRIVQSSLAVTVMAIIVIAVEWADF